MAAYTTVDDAGSFYNALTWTGDGSTTQAQTGLGFQPDFVWIKYTGGSESHVLFDSPRGVEEAVNSNTTAAEASLTGLKSFDADGFSVGPDGKTGSNTYTYIGWSWKGGTTAVPSGGTITPASASFDATSGFGIYNYTGTGATATIAHGLGVAPRFMMFKEVDGTNAWMVYSEKLGNGSALILNTTAVTQNGSTYFNDTSPTSSVFTIGSNQQPNNSGSNVIAYVWSEVQGYSKFNSYIGNGNADGTFVYTGFRPGFVMLKSTGSTDDWQMYDAKRLGYNEDNNPLYANDSGGQGTADEVNLLSNGFKIINTSSAYNTTGGTYMYFAFAESPFVNSEGVPTNAR